MTMIDPDEIEFTLRLVAHGFPVSPINGDVQPTRDPATIRRWLEAGVELQFHGIALKPPDDDR